MRLTRKLSTRVHFASAVGRGDILQPSVSDLACMRRKITKEVEDFNLLNITEIQGEDNMIIPKIGIIMVEQYHPEDLVEDLIVITECKMETSCIRMGNKLQRRNVRQRGNNGGKLSQLTYIRGDNVFKQIYQDSYDMCVTKLENDNKISVSVAGYEVCAMIDTGSTISVISSDLFQKMKQTTKVSVNKCEKQCVVANGSNINLDTIVSVPVKIGKVTFIADLYVLKVEHYKMIIGCDLLKNLRAKNRF